MCPVSQANSVDPQVLYIVQAANLKRVLASGNALFEGRIPDFMDKFIVVHKKVYWRNPKLKSLNLSHVVVN